MSLEAAIAENTAALNKLIEITTRLHDLRADAIEKVSGIAASPVKDAPKTRKAKDAAPAATEDATEESAAEMNISKEPEDRKEPEPTPNPSADTPAKAALAAYMGATDDPDERQARRAKVVEILGKVGAKTAADIPADKETAFVNTMNKLLAQGNLIQPAAAEEDLLG